MDEIGCDTPDGVQPVQTIPVGDSGIPDDDVKLLAAADELFGQRLDGRELQQVDEDALDLDARLEEEADAERLAIGVAQSLLEVRLRTPQRVLAFARIAGREE